MEAFPPSWYEDPRPGTRALSSLAKKSDWRSSLELLVSMKRAKLQPDLFHHNTVLSSLEANWRMAINVLGLMKRSKIALDVFSYSTAISCCSSVWPIAMGLLREMQWRALEANTVSYSAAISACEKWGCWKPALELMHEMKLAKVRCNDFTYNAAISAAGRAAQWQISLALLEEMTSAAVQASLFSYSACTSACQRSEHWEAALALFGGMENLRANHVVYNGVLSACAVTGSWTLALHFLEEMHRSSTSRSSVSYAITICTCADGQAWQQVLDLLRWMRLDHFRANGVEAGSAIAAINEAVGRPAAEALLISLKEDYFSSTSSGRFGAVATLGRIEAFDSPHEVETLGLSTEATLAATSTQLRGAVVTQVSRLDVPTSGALLAALGEQDSCGAWWLLAQFAGRLVSKVYCCLCHGEPPGEPPWHGEVNRPLKVTSVLGVSQATIVKEEDPQGKASCTKYEVLATFQSSNGGVFSLTQAQPVTGRTHQIRVHMASVGLPLVGDRRYGKAFETGRPVLPEWCPSLFLHCWQLRFLSLDAEPHLLCAPLPPALRDALQHLTLRSGHVPAELCGVLCTGG
ncbi:Pentatricopeptide repeat-containing protein 10 [Durusdinium trenchii]|uniref:Chloroplastic (ZmPPR10) n=1 Tax=Durusdinium trenchii TaxID=1381693 RepID=A0ABP0KE67_9DINO